MAGTGIVRYGSLHNLHKLQPLLCIKISMAVVAVVVATRYVVGDNPMQTR